MYFDLPLLCCILYIWWFYVIIIQHVYIVVWLATSCNWIELWIIEAPIYFYKPSNACVWQREQAELYDKIQSETRHTPAYYRVSYYGNGFPSFLSNKTFIYRGKEYEMLGDFSSRIRELFPNAKLLTTLNPPTQDILESAGQCILCFLFAAPFICYNVKCA